MDTKTKKIDIFLSIYLLIIKLLLPFIFFLVLIEFLNDYFQNLEWIKYLQIWNIKTTHILFTVIFMFIILTFSFAQIYRYRFFNKSIKKILEDNDNINKIFKKWKTLNILALIPLFSIWSEIYYIINRKYIYNLLEQPKNENYNS